MAVATPIDKLVLASRSDEEIMSAWVKSRRTGNGDEEAFRILWDRHRETIYRLIVRILGAHASLADEVFQDAWMQVIRADHFVPGSFRSFIRTIATRKALDRLNCLAIQRVDPDPAEETPDRMESVPADQSGPAQIAQAREARQIVMEIVEGMPPLQRAAWTLRYVEGVTYDELAGMMETPLGTAKARVRLANEFLARALAERGIDPHELEEAG